ncbi:hypothetical protein K439DRAFT_553971 [Ramaria rubella]|nr:hypothetical protein K439DRAFT_553971 [Ramaria rubella]
MTVDEWYPLPNGNSVVTHVLYSQTESHGPLALAIAAGVSLCSVTAMLVAIAINGFKTQHEFIRSQVGAYFLSLVLSDLLQASGSIMNARWVVIQGVTTGPLCTAQAALKQTGNVGTALWSLIIAIHTFSLLFIRLRISNAVFFSILGGVWVFIGFVVMMGPVLLQQDTLGPFWGISGYWCWITDAYRVEQLTDEYLFMFITALVSIVLYTLIFFRLRGNIQGFGLQIRFRRVREPWVENAVDDSQMSTVGKQMLWYPMAYTIIILPIAACRWSIIFGHEVPYGATMAADSIFVLSGFVNAILYSTTRKIVTLPTVLPFSRLVHVASSRCTLPRGLSSKASLDDIKFAVSPSKSLPSSPAIDEPWSPRRASEYPSYIRADFAHPAVAPWLPESESEPSDVGHISQPGKNPLLLPMAEIKVSPPLVPPQHSQSTIPEEHLWQPCRSGATDCSPDTPHPYAVAAPFSETPPPDTPPASVHRKRFSGWSLPSVHDGAVRDGASVHTELEDMSFASPSPEQSVVLRSRSGSVNELQVYHWPPRTE